MEYVFSDNSIDVLLVLAMSFCNPLCMLIPLLIEEDHTISWIIPQP